MKLRPSPRAQSYLLLGCLEDEMNGKHARMVLGARNSQILSHITELAQSLRRHPRDVVLPFFQRIAQDEYRAGFDDAVKARRARRFFARRRREGFARRR